MADQKTIITIIWIVFAGICFGAFYAYYHRRLVGDIVRAIIEKGAISKESSVTLSDIGYKSGIKRAFAGFALKKGSAARKFVYTVYEEKAPQKKNEDELFVKANSLENEQRYYVPEEKRITAEVKYDGKGTSLTAVLITIAVFFAVALIAVSILPWILTNANRILSGGNDNPSGSTPETEISQNAEAPEDTQELSDNTVGVGIEITKDEKTGVSTVDPNDIYPQTTDTTTE